MAIARPPGRLYHKYNNQLLLKKEPTLGVLQLHCPFFRRK